MVAATVIALGMRLFTLTRPGFLTHSTEYDDGVYLGAAIRMTQGILPYRGFAFVQPPGILLLMSPVALFARGTSTVAGLGLARLLTVLASTACVPLAGRLVRYRGTLVTALTCGILAVYPADIATAHTLLLEPWMNLLCLTGANAAFTSGRLAARPGRLAWAGAAIGFAGVVKFWAVAPAAVLLVICLLASPRLRWRRIAAYAGALCGGFFVPLAPFVLAAPGAFIQSTLVYQAARVGTQTSLALRLAHVTGLIDILNYYGNVTLTAGGSSLFADSTAADTAPAHPQLLPYLVALALAAIIAGGFLLGRTQLEWFALGTAALALAAVLSYSAFFYHYPAFPGPWLAIITGVAVGRLAQLLPGRLRIVAISLIALVISAAAVLQVAEVAQVRLPGGAAAITSMIPPGACVLTDEVSLTIAANRFDDAQPGCPVIIDSLATTLVLTHGVSVQGGADADVPAVIAWRKILGRAQYVWLSPNQWRRLPWPPYERQWFYSHFWQVAPLSGTVPGFGQLFERT
jgi:alpha-1,2-mannosyltransferase